MKTYRGYVIKTINLLFLQLADATGNSPGGTYQSNLDQTAFPISHFNSHQFLTLIAIFSLLLAHYLNRHAYYGNALW